MNSIKVFIADDHRLFRAGLIELLKEREGVVVVGEAANGSQALERVAQWLPDVVLMDIDFGSGREDKGIQLTQHIAQHYGDRVRVIVLTMHDEPEFLLKAFEAGARGYVLKEAEPDKVLETIREVHRGGVVLSPQQAKKVVERVRRLRQEKVDQTLAHLTTREKDILRWVARGASNDDIASELGLSEKTVRNRLSLIFSKLQVSNRTQAAQRAAKLGLIANDP